MLFDNKPPLVRKNRTLDEFAASTGSSVAASFSQSWTETPVDSIFRDREIIRANVGEGEVKYTPYSTDEFPVSYEPQGKKLTTEAAQTQIKNKGLSLKVPAEGYTQKALDIIIDRKEQEIARSDKINSSKGIIAATGKFSAAMAAQLLDPINVAASFIPIIAPSKYAAMLKAAGSVGIRAAIRGGVGAAEGLVGAALVEPVIYMAKQREQADYTMATSLMNIGMGTVFGAGLHAGAGAVGDAIKKGRSPSHVDPQGYTAKRVAEASPETREAMLKTAVAQEAQSTPSNVDAVAAYDTALSRVESNDISGSAVAVKVSEKSDFVYDFDIDALPVKAVESDLPVKTDLSSPVVVHQSNGEFKVLSGQPKANQRGKVRAVVIPEQDVIDLKSKGVIDSEVYHEWVKSGKAETAQAKVKNGEIEPVIKQDTPPPAQANKGQSLENTAASTASRGADPVYAKAVDEKLKQPEISVDEELAFYMDNAKSIEDNLSIKVDNAVELDNAIKKAESDATALEAAVTCRMTK